MSSADKPKLRLLDFQPVYHHGERMWLLRDPWQLSDNQLIFPQGLAQLLLLCDGTRTPEEIHADLVDLLGADVPYGIIEDSLTQLDRTYLLANERFEQRRIQVLSTYRAQPHRPPALAGPGYPADPTELSSLFNAYLNGNNIDENRTWRGMVSPHIDYQRGGPVYAQVWQRVRRTLREVDLVLIFGTDHNGSPGSITFTRLPYATPYGVLPTDSSLIDRLAAAVGNEYAYAQELNHRNEHSIELSAVWLHRTFREMELEPCPMVPILVGSFHHFLSNGIHPADDETFNRFLDTLKQETHGRRVLAVGSVDLAHVGPAFGDGFEMDATRRQRLRESDQHLMEAIARGDATDFFRQIRQVNDRYRICGFAPLYLMLSYLDGKEGVQVAYDQCPADHANTSLVSICGLLLS